jgi:hypothetical protein
LHSRRPHFVAHPLLVGVVVVGLSAVWAADVVILVVHAVLRVAVLGLGVDVAVVSGSRRWEGLLRRRLPAHGCHVRAAVCTVRARLVVVCRRRRLKDWWRAVRIRVRSDGWARVVHAGGVGLGGKSRRGTRARLGHLVAHVGRNVDPTHVRVVGGLAVHSRYDTSGHAVCRREGESTIIGRWCVEGGSGLRVVTAIGAASSARGGSTRGEGSSRSSSSLFHSARVVVLVTRQSGATRKSLLTIGVWALVRALSRVNTTVTRQRAGITERLQRVSSAKRDAC